MKTADLLIEIGCEELPPKALHKLTNAFADDIIVQLAKLRLLDANQPQLQYFSSPRRMAVLIPDVPKEISASTQERTGPAVKAAFDKDGNPTPAAVGFAKSCGVLVDQLERKQTDKGEQLVATIQIAGKPAAEIIPVAVTNALKNLPIPKRMRWGAGDAEFIRPIHWVMMLHGKDVIDAEILGVQSGRETRGHRFHSSGFISIKRPSDYLSSLKSKGKVKVNSDKGSLVRELATLVGREAAKLNGVAVGADVQGDLLAEVAAIVEWPIAVVGGFDEKYLALPEEVLITTLQVHQRYFPVRSQQGKLLPTFITFANIDSRKPDIVRRGNERVVVPRLEDAMFFWNNDRKTPLDERREKLAMVTFQKGLGSLAEKSNRVAKLAEEIARQIGGDPVMAKRAADLAKCDLITDMVGEFPELQGVMGKYYARNDGEPAEVCQAINEQYLPRFAGDELPQSKTGMALALADKLDTVCGVLLLGKMPTGSKDPFGLRRAALGALRIAIECELNLDFVAQIGQACAAHSEQNPSLEIKGDTDTRKLDINSFVHERLRAYYEEQNINPDVYAAIDLNEFENANDWRKPLDFDSRLNALQSFLAMNEAENLIAANKRIKNILPKDEAGVGDYDIELFSEDAESKLHTAIETVSKEIEPLVNKRNYRDALKKLAALREPVDKFFDDVMVMADDTTVRNNRISLLRRLYNLFRQFADLSQIQTLQ